MERRAKNRAEYDEAVSVIQWIRARGNEALAADDTAKAQMLAVSASSLASLFLLPPAGDVAAPSAGTSADEELRALIEESKAP